MVDEEQILVNTIDSSAKTLTVTRGYSGTTAAAIAKGTEVEFQFVKGEEGAEAKSARFKSRTREDNYTQIFSDTVEVSGSAQSIDQYGISDLYDYEKAKKQLELALQLEKALISGIKYDDGKVRQMNGLRQMIKTNVTNASKTAVTVKLLTDVVQNVFEKGGLASGGQYAFVVPAKQKRAISELQNEKIRIVQSETSRGQVVDHLVTDFGQFPIVMNDNVKADEIYFVDTNRLHIRPLNDRSFHHVELGVTGDRIQGYVLGEFTLELQQEQAHARIKGLA